MSPRELDEARAERRTDHLIERLRAETAALAEDPDDRAEAQAVLRDMRGESRAGTEPARKFYSVPEVAAILGVSRSTVYRAVRAGEFPAVRIRGRYIIPAKALDQMEDEALGLSPPTASEAPSP
jgi:excisionase family DNA binding protein